MNRPRGRRSLVLCAVLLPGLFTTPPTGASTRSAAEPPKPGGQAAYHQVTLITGDVVRVEKRAGSARAEVVRRTGRSSWYDTSRTSRGLYVQPEEAAGPLAAGLVDRELFNVTALITQGYDDAHGQTLPLILAYGRNRAVAQAPAPTGARAGRLLPSINGRAATVDKATATKFWTGLAPYDKSALPVRPKRAALGGGVEKVWLDQKVRASLDKSVPLIGGPAAWQRGYDGKGVKVAVLDTGAQGSHPDLKGRIDAAKNFTDRGGAGDVNDAYGHGTHVASILAGSGAGSKGKYTGVAPKARMLVGKVLADDGSGQASWVISAMEWAAQQRAAVVNLSLGGLPTGGDDPQSQAVNSLTGKYGTLFVAAAGNRSFHTDIPQVATPGTADAALTVGITDNQDQVNPGGRLGKNGDRAVKPEIFAPGVNIRAAESAAAEPDGDEDPLYTTKSGTSMATPHVAGAAVLLRQQHPDWAADKLKAALTSTAKPLPDPVPEARGGRVDIDRATRQGVLVDTGVFHAGYFARPYDPAKMKVTRTLTYRNHGKAAVTLKLAGQGPAGVVSVSPAALTLAPGGSARATVTVDAGAAEPGQGTAAVVASGDDNLEVRTVIGLYKQDDTVDAKIKVLDRHGKPAYANLWIKPYEQDGPSTPYYDPVYIEPSTAGGLTLRLPQGKFHMLAAIHTLDASGRYIEEDSLVGDPLVDVRHPNLALTFDARKANPITLRTPRRSEPRSLGVQWARGSMNQHYTRLEFQSDLWRQPRRLSIAPTKKVSDAPFYLLTGIDAGLPVLETELLSPRRRLPAVPAGGPEIEGRKDREVIHVGAARPDDIKGKDLRGKVALIRETPAVSYTEQVQAVQGAGAAVAMLYSAQPGVFWPGVGAQIPVLALPRREGEDLARRRTRLRFTGNPRTPYAYDLLFTHKNAVPGTMAYRARTSELAEVRNRLHGFGGKREYTELSRGGVDRVCDGCGVTMSDATPRRSYVRTEYVTARPGVDMRAGVTIGGGLGWTFDFWPITPRPLKPRQVVTQNWVRGPVAPGPANSDIHRNGRSYRTSDNYLSYNLTGGRDSDGHWTPFPVATPRSRLFAGDKLLTEGFLSGWVAVPAERTTYKLELETEHDGTQFIPLSTKTSSTWTFTSAAVPAEATLPLVDVLYTDVTDGRGRTLLDLGNAVPADRWVALRLRPGHQKGSSASPVRVTKAEVSYDGGATWQKAYIRTGPGGTFRAEYRHPPLSRTDGYASIRVSAQDREGNKLDQTIVRAYRLKR